MEGVHRASTLDELADRLIRRGREAGLDAVGVASATPFGATRRTLEHRKATGLAGGMQFTYRNPSRSTDPSRALSGARALVVGARSYRRDDRPRTEAASPNEPLAAVARYSWVDHYRPLRDALQRVADDLVEDGWQAKVLADDNALVDREAAYRAGLGFYGKNTNLLLHGRGSEFVLGAVITDAPLPPSADAPATDEDDGGTAARHDGCGSCTRCLPACPTGALIAPGVLDARRCLAWLLQAEGTFPREHRVALGGRIYGCDECQEVCPPNRLEIRRRPPPPPEPDAEPTVDLVAMLEASDEELVNRHGRWYIPKREPRYLRRNALVALANVGDGDDERTAHALTAWLGHDDPLLRAHAVWAAVRLGRADLVSELARTETDPDVLAELHHS